MVDGFFCFRAEPFAEVDFHLAPATSSAVKRIMTLVVEKSETMKGGVAGEFVGAVPLI